MSEAEFWIREWGHWLAQDTKEIEKMCGFPSASAGFSTGGMSSEEAFDHLVEQADMRMIRLIDRAVNDLSPQLYAAVMNKYCRCVFTHRGDPRALADEAVALVWKSVQRWI